MTAVYTRIHDDTNGGVAAERNVLVRFLCVLVRLSPIAREICIILLAQTDFVYSSWRNTAILPLEEDRDVDECRLLFFSVTLINAKID